MQLAKPALDVGLFTNDIDAQLRFWQQDMQVAFDHLLPVGGGLHQHRHTIGDSVLKINHSRDPLPRDTPSGLSALTLHKQTVAEGTYADPDGNRVTVVAPKDASPLNLTLTLSVSDRDRHAHFYGQVLGLDEAGAHTFSIGASRLVQRCSCAAA